jgi:hypothetical protein
MALSLAATVHAQGRDALGVELVATRVILTRYPGALASLDSSYALAGHAPPPMTSVVRPAARQRALADSLRVALRWSPAISLRIRASQPILRGSEARIDVTLDELRRGTERAQNYETVAFVFDWLDGKWTVRERVTLGQS